jgi:hypothetical protein
MLAVSYHSADRAGVVMYRIESDGQRLAGRWTVAGDDGTVYPETLTKLPREAVESELGNPPEKQTPPKKTTPSRRDGSLEL